jgi:hypothetical protein
MEDKKMKKILTTLALILVILSASANVGFSELNIKLFDNSTFIVSIDNITYKSFGDKCKIENIVPGNHFLSITKNVPAGWYGYTVPKTVYTGYINIPVNKKIFSMINFYGSFVILSQTPLLTPNDGISDCSYNYDSGCDNDANYVPAYVPYITAPNFMSLKSVVNNATFESSKIQIVKEAISTNFFKSEQVRQLLKLFTFESSKLEIAKLAYAKTIDKGNYFIVDDDFTFESSIAELNNFILGK